MFAFHKTRQKMQVEEDAAAAWLEVIERRVREVESGEVECRPIEEVLGRLRQRLQ